MHFAIMAKRLRDDQLVIRVASSLRGELEAAAAEDGRELSDLVRRVLIDFAEKRFIERQSLAA
jgi:hypothetical protein